MRKRSARMLGCATAVTALAGVLTAAPAQAAPAAATCSGWGSGIGFYDEYDITEGASTPIRRGPYGKCTADVVLPAGSSVDISCYVTNDYGNTWTYVHFHSPYGRKYGWIYDGNLQGNGSHTLC